MAKKGKTYRTSSGNQVDFGALLLANETEPALGNMNVNARGDEIDPAGNITKSREEVMREYNELNTMVPSDDSIPEGTGIEADDDWQDWEPNVPVEKTPEPYVTTGVKKETAPVEENKVTPEKTGPRSVGHVIEEEHAEQQQEQTPAGGLAAAVARAKNINTKDNIQQPKHIQEQNIKGVRRI
jgi:hypothetical protein